MVSTPMAVEPAAGADAPDPDRHEPIRLVIFDMDGVLCAYDLAVRLDRLAGFTGRSAGEIRAAIWDSGFEDASDVGAIDAESYLAGFATRLGHPLTLSQWLLARRAAMTPDPAMLSLVAGLRDRVAVALLTNNGFLIRQTIDQLFPQLPELFGPRLFVSAEFGTKKPDPNIYRALLARLGLPARATLMIDDKTPNIAGAEQAGLTGYLFDGAPRLKGWLARRGLVGDRPT